ncbi:MAG: translation initiation factor IF-3 [Candidatus Pacebacteria bacterium CG_4_9_14_3_um_filter_40_12]|nr:MAG: translation initiation factor IF-3 [Candidatus Pacebacteria bacterium CG10_big_fil_rev_8_21_14_0_10_40_26]PIZ79041.1 MAG: translation initiation factor IF-3 [Candidatus Pacebacteria bacterium CG_4_10_14_0_2_um_filter_40_20]PJA68513.1 MAG: translation initiation factor IF-3 [Candidatus Pacebacteria bacterium CG_4_9_14_3_um_filter_40_12]PJC41897.1 MAG: translation initiation factor IF-3 [Candidatus Pacebacteria bacterium CG_4_9_14_0_2_um_filter_40_15]
MLEHRLQKVIHIIVQNNKSNYSRKNRIAVNEFIRATEVRVLTEQREMLGIMTKAEALEKAREVDKDLVLVNEKAQPPIVKIIDLAKYKYQEQQREAKNRKTAKSQDLKEVRFSPFMGEGDLVARLNKVKKFLEKGDKVRLSLMFKGRAITKKEFGYEIFDRVISETSEIATVEVEPKMLGKKLMAQLMPSKK